MVLIFCFSYCTRNCLTTGVPFRCTNRFSKFFRLLVFEKMHHCCNRMNEFHTKKKIPKTQQSKDKISIKSNVFSGHFNTLMLYEIHLPIACLRQFALSLTNSHQTVGRDHCCNRMNKVNKNSVNGM